jgi:hypothetical protein
VSGIASKIRSLSMPEHRRLWNPPLVLISGIGREYKLSSKTESPEREWRESILS